MHDIHAWTVTTGYDVLSAHVTADTSEEQEPGQVLHALREIASSEFGISHVTIQLEEPATVCEEGHHTNHDHAERGEADTESQRDPRQRSNI